MPINLFISFAGEDVEQLESFRALAKNPNHRLKFRDRSQQQPVTDRVGKPLPYPPNDHRGNATREDIKKLFDKSTRMVILVGETTHESQWVNWEIRTFFDRKKGHPGSTSRRLIALRLKGNRKAKLPKAVLDLGIHTIKWDPDAFAGWLGTDLNEMHRA